jgi:hypothetical protein
VPLRLYPETPRTKDHYNACLSPSAKHEFHNSQLIVETKIYEKQDGQRFPLKGK